MPRGDGTGPAGMGSMTGRGMGYCAGYNTPGYMNPGFGRGLGRGYGRGFGRGFGRRAYQVAPMPYPPYAPAAPQQYREPTKAELLKELRAEKAEIDKAIKDLEQKKK